MDFRRLEAFCRVFELKSFSKAAQKLFLSQPTVSAHISTLEKELGVKLFDRMGRWILPTSAGEVLYRYSLEIFAYLDQAKAEIQLLQDRVAGQLFLGGSTIPAYYLLPSLLASFTENYPEVSINLSVGDTSTIADKVQDGSLMLAVVGDKDENTDLTYMPLCEDELILISHEKYARKKQNLRIDELFELPWIMRNPGSGTQHALERAMTACEHDYRQLKVSVLVESTQAVLQCVKAGLGVSMTSRIAAKDLINKKEVVELKCPQLSAQRNFYCIFQEKRYFFPVVRYFIDFLDGKFKEKCNLASQAS